MGRRVQGAAGCSARDCGRLTHSRRLSAAVVGRGVLALQLVAELGPVDEPPTSSGHPRSFLTATCPTGHWGTRGEAEFSDGTRLRVLHVFSSVTAP